MTDSPGGPDLTQGRVDHGSLLTSAPAGDLTATQVFLAEELPYAWLDAYIATNPHHHNVHRITVEGLEYLLDFSTDLDIDSAMAGNLCRCGTYPRIRAAINQVASGEKAAPAAAEQDRS
jgi:hypothetical protein